MPWGRAYVTSFGLPGTESQRALDLLKRDFKAQSGDADAVVFHVSRGTIDSPAVRAAITPLLARVGALPHVAGVVSPYSSRGAVQVSPNRMTAFATVNYDQPANVLAERDRQAAAGAGGGGSRARSAGRGGRPGGRERGGVHCRPGDRGRGGRSADHPADDVRLAGRGWDAADHRRAGPDHRRGVDRARHPRHEPLEHLPGAGADDRPGRRDRLFAVHRHSLPGELPGVRRRGALGGRGDGHLGSGDPAGRRDRRDRAARHVRHRRRRSCTGSRSPPCSRCCSR